MNDIDLNNNNIYSLGQYAKLKKVTLKTIYNWIDAGLLHPITIGKSKFILKPKPIKQNGNN